MIKVIDALVTKLAMHRLGSDLNVADPALFCRIFCIPCRDGPVPRIGNLALLFSMVDQPWIGGIRAHGPVGICHRDSR